MLLKAQPTLTALLDLSKIDFPPRQDTLSTLSPVQSHTTASTATFPSNLLQTVLQTPQLLNLQALHPLLPNPLVNSSMKHIHIQALLYAPIFANRRVAMASQLIFPYMTMASLLAWRGACRDTYLVATKELHRSLYIFLDRFVPDPFDFLQALTRWSGLIIGEAALSQILHDPSICGNTLEIAVGCGDFEKFLHRLRRLLPFGTHVVTEMNKPAPPSFRSLRLITRIAEFQLVSGLVIQVYESSTASACAVVCGAWTTALMNFVTESSFGCAYPRLTLNYCGISCDGRLQAKRWLDTCTEDRLRSKGFQFAPYSTDWASFSNGPYSSCLPPTPGCGKLLHVCPFQGRYFGDPGSLIIFFDGFFVDIDNLRESKIAPYGDMTAWRIPTVDTCVGACVEDESVLPAYVSNILVRFMGHKSAYSGPAYVFPARTVSLAPGSRTARRLSF